MVEETANMILFYIECVFMKILFRNHRETYDSILIECVFLKILFRNPG